MTFKKIKVFLCVIFTGFVVFTLITIKLQHEYVIPNYEYERKSEIQMTMSPTKEDAKEKDKNEIYDIPILEVWDENKRSNEQREKEQNIFDMPPESEWLKVSPVVDKSNMTTIPQLVHKIIIEDSGDFPSVNDMQKMGNGALENAHKSWIENNPTYQVHAFNLQSCRKYLYDHFHPVFLRAFDCIQAYAGKTDFMRMAVVYREGGWYSDWKEVCLKKNLLDNLGQNVQLVITHDLPNPPGIQNCFFGATSRHDLIANMIRKILHNIYTEHYGKNPLFVTGPQTLGEVYEEYVNTSNKEKKGIREVVFKLGHVYSKVSGTQNTPNFTDALIQHKCDECGRDQNWKNGNNYNTLWQSRQYLCPHASSLFQDYTSDLERMPPAPPPLKIKPKIRF